jgi:hypothetical protein
MNRFRRNIAGIVTASALLASTVVLFARKPPRRRANPEVQTLAAPEKMAWSPQALGEPILRDPIWVYHNFRRHSLGIQVGNQPLPAGLSLNVWGQGTSIRDEPVELDEPCDRTFGQHLPPREFRMDLVQLQRIPKLLGFVAESTLRDTREKANLVPGHENVLG